MGWQITGKLQGIHRWSCPTIPFCLVSGWNCGVPVCAVPVCRERGGQKLKASGSVIFTLPSSRGVELKADSEPCE